MFHLRRRRLSRLHGPRMSAPRPAAIVATLLAEHQLGFRDRKDPFYCTGCEWVAVVVADGRDGNGVTIEDQHLAHLAAVIAPLLDELTTLRAAVERVEALADLWESWDGTRPHPGESSPRQREQLCAALRGGDQ